MKFRCWALRAALLLAPLASLAAVTPAPSWKGELLHLFDVVYGFVPDSDPSKLICSPPGTQFYVVDDDGATLTVSVDRNGNTKFPLSAWCAAGYVESGTVYTIAKARVQNERMTTQSWVGGILAVPFKFHLSDRSITVGSTIGGYVGYRTSFFNAFSATPILGGGLAMINATPINGTSSQTVAGLSLATGVIGSVGVGGLQYGLVLGCDWLGRSAHYAYEGKPWLAIEIGYDFSH